MHMIAIGHRGAAGYEPENTLRSFAKALALHADMLECDVHLSRDGELIVLHDGTLDRTTDGCGPVSRYTVTELRRMDAGKGEHVPTLREVAVLAAEKVPLNIELKGDGSGAAVARFIGECVKKGRSAEDFIISSFRRGELEAFRRSNKDVRIGVLMSGIPGPLIDAAKELGAYSVNPHYRFVTRKFMGDAHKAGFKVFPWTIDEPEDIARMRALGADGVFSNFPDRVK